MLQRLLGHIVLPRQISDFERAYLERMNRIGLWFFALHIPVFALIAYFNDTGPLLAAALALAALAGPALAYFTFQNPRNVSLTYGFASMLLGGVLVHVGQGPVQIEMHFYFFALLAMLAVFGNPLVILVAAVTVALHHLVLWIVLPTSVFNYAAPIWVVCVHAAFVVLESIATCYIARSFFDNVIGLEKIVQARTAELDARNGDMRLVLDNVGQGFLGIGRDGVMSTEHSAILEHWLGEPEPGGTFASYLGRKAQGPAEMFELGLQEVIDGYLPLEVTLDQLPKRFQVDSKSFSLEYRPILADGELVKLLTVVTDITASVERERLEQEQREMIQMFDRLMRDRFGFLEFLEETREIVDFIDGQEQVDPAVFKRLVHTLKGNAAIFGVASIADHCHAIETRIEEEGVLPAPEAHQELQRLVARLETNVSKLCGEGARTNIEIESAEYEATLSAVRGNEPREALARRIASWWLEPTARRLERIAEQTQRIAARLNKGPVTIEVRDHGLRLESARWAAFWSSFIHLIRNAVDHGLESKAERKAAGKSELGRVELSTRVEGGSFVVEISDDGRGVPWAAVAERARAAGLPHATQEDLVEAVFTDGISTAAQVSDVSGRGIGMAAVRAQCVARGGSVRLKSEAGVGTRVIFVFPIASMAVDRSARHAA